MTDGTEMVKRRRKRKIRSPGLAGPVERDPAQVMEQNQVVLDKIEEAGFDSFEDFLAAHSGMTLVEMAHELDVTTQRFIVYHTAWLDARYLAGDFGPLRLEDDDE